MFKKISHVLALLALLAGFVTITPVSLAAAGASEKGISPEAFLNTDGTLNLTRESSGSFDLTGWDVQLDAQRGPVFSRQNKVSASLAAFGEWTNVGGWSGPINNMVSEIAVSGSDV